MLNMNLRPSNECKYDAVSLGEIMLRLDPGEGRIHTARDTVAEPETVSRLTVALAAFAERI